MSEPETVEAQARELLGDGGLRQLHDLLELGNRLLAFDQNAEDEQAAFMRQGLQQIAGLAGLLHQLVDILRGGLGLKVHHQTLRRPVKDP